MQFKYLLKSYFPNNYLWMVFVGFIAGVIMFIVSDAGVCLMMFDGRTEIKIKGKSVKIDPVNIFNYCGGQMLIAASVLV